MEYAVLNFGRWCWTSYWLTIPRAFYMATLQHLVWSHLLICTHLLDTCVHVHLIAQLCLTLCDRIDCSPLGSSVHGNSSGKNTGVGCQVLLQGIFQPRDRTQVSHIAGRFFTVWVTREAHVSYGHWSNRTWCVYALEYYIVITLHILTSKGSSQWKI